MLSRLTSGRLLASISVTAVLIAGLALSGFGGQLRPDVNQGVASSKAAAVTVMDAFAGGTDGANVGAALIQGVDGDFYGTTDSGGDSNLGTVFAMTPDGARTVLHSFNSTDGARPSGLFQATDGSFYGTTRLGGASDRGTVFKMTPDGTVTVLHSFGNTDGSYPSARLIQAADGDLYGTTTSGGAGQAGTVFKMTPSGTATVLHEFVSGTEGTHPEVALIQATDGNFYGTTATDGAFSHGTVFRMTADGTVTVLHSFVGTDGDRPIASLLQGTDGNLYGSTESGGAFGYGTVFSITIAGGFRVLHAFNDADGANPSAALIEATAGTFYGTTANGGASRSGTVFRMSVDGTIATLHTFTGGNDGSNPGAGLLQGTDGRFYGTTRTGGASESGVVFLLSILSVTVTSPNGGEKLYTGTPYTITWTATEGAASIDHFDVDYSIDSGSTWNPVPGCTGVSGAARSCGWVSPGPVTTQARIKVTATDAASATLSDTSNGLFKISTGTGIITISSPNTSGTNWGIGSRQQIAWKHNAGAGSFFTIELSRNGGVTYTETLATAAPTMSAGSATFNWQVTGPATNQARVRVRWVNGPSTSDTSNANFTIAAAFISVTVPKAGVTWVYNSSQVPKWKTNLGAGDTVDVLLSTDGGTTFPTTLASGVIATAKQATVTAPTLGTPTTTARIRVVWSNAPASFSAAGVNGGNFKISPAFITVTSPNGGEVWAVGSTRTITWTSNLGATENVKIELSQDGGATYPITVRASTPSDGTHPVTVLGAWSSTTARIRITWLADVAVTDASNGNFIIGASSSSPVSITDFAFSPSPLTVPVGATVTWTNNGMVSHTSTSDTGVWASALLPPGGTFSFTFTSTGTFPYHCQIHFGMVGTIIVE